MDQVLTLDLIPRLKGANIASQVLLDLGLARI